MILTYNKAYNDLSKLVDQIEDEKIQLDTLADKVKQAKELIELCETKLRTIEKEVKTALTDKKPTG
jgi:exodeoxyribonuclease VII small subunit